MVKLGNFFTLIALLALAAIANPSGYSYYHYAVDYNWTISTGSGFTALLGVILSCVVMFFFWSAWRTTEMMGKLIFFVLLGVGCFLGFTMGAFENSVYTSWFVIGVLYTFFFWGMFYPRIKYSLFKTRSVGEVEAE